jgi:hypothetical protein
MQNLVNQHQADKNNEKHITEMLKSIGENIDRRDRLIEKLQKENDKLRMRLAVLEGK